MESIFNTVLQLLKNYKVPVHILGDLHLLRGVSGLNMYDLFPDDYKALKHLFLTSLEFYVMFNT